MANNNITSRFFNLKNTTLSWIVWGLAGSFSLYVYLTQVLLSIMIPDLSKAFKIDAAGIGLLSATFFYTYLPMQIPAGILVDKFGSRRVLILSSLLTGISVIAFSMAKTLTVAEISRIITGFVCAPSIAVTLYLAANWFLPSRFAVMVGLTEMAAMLGGVVGKFGLAQSVAAVGWRITVAGCGVFALLLGFLVWLVIHDKARNEFHSAPSDSTIQLKSLFKLPQMWLVGIIAGFIFVLPTAFAGLWAVPFLSDLYDVGVKKAAFASSMVFVGIAIGGPFAGWFSDKLQRRRPVIITAACLSLVILMVIIYVPISFNLMVVLLFLLGFVMSAYVLAFAVAREITPKSVRATALSFTNLLSIVLGSPLFQPLIGFLLELDRGGQTLPNLFPIIDYKIAFSVLPICIGIAIILSFFMKETYCKEKGD